MLNTFDSKKYRQYKPSKLIDNFNIKDYVVLDVETTGLSPKTEEIIEIALAKVANGEPAGKFTSLIKPRKSVPPRIVSLTGLTDAMLENAPSFSDIAKDVEQFIGRSIVLAHNAIFDLSFLSEAFSKCGIKSNFQYLDTIKIAKMAYPNLKNYKLETLISELDLAETQSHRAMDDVQCTLKLYQLACKKLGNPLINAITACCYPVEDYQLSYKSAPLKGFRFALLGKFTFTYSAAKKLISEAGGTVVDLKNPNADYIACGITEPADIASEYEDSIRSSIALRQKGEKNKYINEVDLLRLCGVTFYDEEQTVNEGAVRNE